MIRQRNFQPVKLSPTRHSIGGLLAVAAVLGTVVSRKSGETDVLEKATGKAGYFLRRDTVSAADLKTFTEQDILYPDKGGFETPYLVGGAVQAEDFREVWVEGADLLDASMDVNATVGKSVTTNAGKIALLTNSATQESLGTIELRDTAINSGTYRFLIRVDRSGKTVTV